MSFEADFYAALVADATLVAVVANRVYPELAPQAPTAPFVVFTRVFTEPKNSLDGFATNLEKIRVQVDCYAVAFDDLIALSAAVAAAVPDDGTWPVHGLLINEVDFGLEENTRLLRRMLEFSVFHRS